MRGWLLLGSSIVPWKYSIGIAAGPAGPAIAEPIFVAALWFCGRKGRDSTHARNMPARCRRTACTDAGRDIYISCPWKMKLLISQGSAVFQNAVLSVKFAYQYLTAWPPIKSLLRLCTPVISDLNSQYCGNPVPNDSQKTCHCHHKTVMWYCD